MDVYNVISIDSARTTPAAYNPIPEATQTAAKHFSFIVDNLCEEGLRPHDREVWLALQRALYAFICINQNDELDN